MRQKITSWLLRLGELVESCLGIIVISGEILFIDGFGRLGDNAYVSFFVHQRGPPLETVLEV